MKSLGLNEIREKFLTFFEEKEHLRLESFSLVPQNDKSLLLINSGMAPLKPFFTGQQVPPKKRVTTCQKCIRTGDIENVGKTARHGTFFEMLGNFSFGDYFKEEIILWSWEFMTEVMEIPSDRLYVSVYEDDNEAYQIWKEKIGLDKSRIFKMGKKDNFWEHGVGPCGPCSEIYYDKGEQYGCGKPECTVGCDCDRYMEIWNLVFTQFNKEEDGAYSKLANPNIDTGMGLERVATVMQNVDSIFDVDTIKTIRDKVCQIADIKYNEDYKKDISIRIITDHIRSITFMTSDGVHASNEGRGYVLRRLLRRAARHGKLLGIENKFLADLCDVVIEVSKNAYPQIEEKKDYIKKSISVEEERFYETLNQGMDILKEKIKRIKEDIGESVMKGEDSFKLYDTYGFPFELMKEILQEEEIGIDEDSFHQEMERQRKRARAAREISTYMGSTETVYHRLPPDMSSTFIGYDNYTINDAEILALIVDDEIVNNAQTNDKVSIICNKTPFYAESGGQTGDRGTIKTNTAFVEVTDCIKFGNNKIIHIGIVKSGVINVGENVNILVDTDNRIATSRNHTVTHLLQKALREVLGNHIEQAGSFVSGKRLRFDFTHFEPISLEDLGRVEKIVNQHILASMNIIIKEMSIDEAKKLGAMALFGEKYGDIVRVVNISDYSIELCGGTHLKNTSQAGIFKVLSESSVAAGIRRIDAITGLSALNFYEEQEYLIGNLMDKLKVSPNNFNKKIAELIDENKELKKELEKLKSKMSTNIIDDILKNVKQINGINIICEKVNGFDINALRNLGDKIKEKLNNSIIVIASGSGNKADFIVMASKEAVDKGANAGTIVKAAAAIAGGGGGGRPNMAQAGGKDSSKIPQSLERAMEIIKSQIQN